MDRDETGKRGRGPQQKGRKGPGSAPSDSSGPLPDLLRRAMTMGLSSFFTTEEAIRKALGDTLPQDWVDFAAFQSDRARAEFLDRLVAEFGRVLENVDIAELTDQVLDGRTIEINAKIRLGPRDETPDRVAHAGAASGKKKM